MFEFKKQGKLCLMALNIDAKFEGNDFASRNDIGNLGNFHQTNCKCQNWDFGGILISKVENERAQNLL